MRVLQFLERWDRYNAGEVAGFADDVADDLITQRKAVAFEQVVVPSPNAKIPAATESTQVPIPSPSALAGMKKADLHDLAVLLALEVPEDPGMTTKEKLLAAIELVRDTQ